MDRIKQQMALSNKDAQVVPQPEVEGERIVCGLSPEELKRLFMSEVESAATPTVQTNERVFDGIEDFVGWYLNVKEKFSPGQVVALSSLIQYRDVINIGCGCKRQQRKAHANEYYRTFWTNNLVTDLPQMVLFVGEFSSVSFAVDGNVFAKVPTPTPENV